MKSSPRLPPIRRVLAENSLDIHHLADLVAGKHDKGATKAELQEAYRNGYRDGRDDDDRFNDRDDDDGDDLSWYEVARFCYARIAQLNDKEAEFIRNMYRLTTSGRTPSEKQGRWLDDVYFRLSRKRK